jgi:hypothetical protein
VATRGVEVGEVPTIAEARATRGEGAGRSESPGGEEAVAACAMEVSEAARTAASRAGNPGGEEAVAARSS